MTASKCKVEGCHNEAYVKGECYYHRYKAYQKAYQKVYHKTDKWKAYQKAYQKAYNKKLVADARAYRSLKVNQR